MKQLILVIAAVTSITFLSAQQKQDVLDYIAKYKDVALEEMVRCKIPASITLAQGIQESSCGKSPLSKTANNHFGIKCKDEWTGKKYYMNDDAPNECFRVYEHASASYADHSDFLITRPRYANLFQLPITDYKAWATGLKASGYATNPKYAQLLINTIETYGLDKYDQTGIAMIEKRDKALYASTAPVKTQPVIAQAAPIQKSSPSVTSAPAATSNTKLDETAFAGTTPSTGVKEKLPTVKEVTTEKPVANATKKEFSVNGIRALRADGGEDPYTIAYNYNIDYANLLFYNDMVDGERFKNGENIFLQPKRNRAEQEMYTVQPGESMHDISQKFGIKLKELYLKNMVAINDQVYAGENINLQGHRNTAPRTMAYADFLKSQNRNKTATSQSALPKITQPSQYQVQQSDTLYSIARKFNMSVEELKALNNLQSADVQAGQNLVVSK